MQNTQKHKAAEWQLVNVTGLSGALKTSAHNNKGAAGRSCQLCVLHTDLMKECFPFIRLSVCLSVCCAESDQSYLFKCQDILDRHTSVSVSFINLRLSDQRIEGGDEKLLLVREKVLHDFTILFICN